MNFPDGGAVQLPDLGGRGEHREGLTHEFGAGGYQLVGDQSGAGSSGFGGEECGLASGARAEVEPQLSFGGGSGAAEGECRYLRSLVLHPSGAAANRVE